VTPVESAEKCIGAVRSRTDGAVLFLSLGKDSLVLLDMLYPRFRRLVCVFMYFVKGLEHVERWLAWAKARYPGAEFMQIPHWNLTYILRSGLYCAPQPDVRLLTLKDAMKSVRMATGLEYVFLGMKKADSMNRRLQLMGYEKDGYIRDGAAYPLADWTQRHVLAYMRQNGLPEPVRYGLKASNGIGFNEDCFLWLEERFPGDLEKIYEVFPMSERILFEAHRRKEDERNKQRSQSQCQETQKGKPPG
jgi:sulfate adenylyltransferase subunit 2